MRMRGDLSSQVRRRGLNPPSGIFLIGNMALQQHSDHNIRRFALSRQNRDYRCSVGHVPNGHVPNGYVPNGYIPECSTVPSLPALHVGA